MKNPTVHQFKTSIISESQTQSKNDNTTNPAQVVFHALIKRLLV
jgi:hypothetical protein